MSSNARSNNCYLYQLEKLYIYSYIPVVECAHRWAVKMLNQCILFSVKVVLNSLQSVFEVSSEN